MLGWLIGLINPLGPIVRQVLSTQERLAVEANSERRIDLEGELAVLEARRDAILAAQSDPMERWVRIGFAAPFVLYIWKLVVWDKLLGWGVTDGLSTDLWTILYIVLGGYFVDTVVRRLRR